jgi:hypothetical protein
MSYYAVMTTSANLSQGYVYYATNRSNYSPTLLGRVKLTHPSRDCIGITFGIGSSKKPSWTYAFRQFQILKSTITAQPFPANNLVFDLSDGASYLSPTDSVYVQCIDDKKDKLTGTINYLSAQYLPAQKTGVSTQTPVAIPDYNVAVQAKLKIPLSLDRSPAPTGPSEMRTGGTAEQGSPIRVISLTVGPNPTKGRFSVRLVSAGSKTSVAVWDAAGRLVKTVDIGSDGGATLDLRAAQAGVYFVAPTGSPVDAQKVVVQH